MNIKCGCESDYYCNCGDTENVTAGCSGSTTGQISVDMDRFKVKETEYGGWIVPAPVKDAIEDLQEKHNNMVDFLSTITRLNRI